VRSRGRESIPDLGPPIAAKAARRVRLLQFWQGTTRAVSPRTEGESKMSANITHSTDGSSLAEVVDRILDRGCVIDAFVRVTLVGIELLAIEARVVIASVDTWLKYAEAVGLTTTFEQMNEIQN
jgi:hypothetical protein